MEKKISVFMDEDANYCIIAGTSNRKEAEKALRATEEEWYGKYYEEKPIPMDDFSAADLLYGKRKGEECYYWGNEPKQFFDGEYETEEGFIMNLA